MPSAHLAPAHHRDRHTHTPLLFSWKQTIQWHSGGGGKGDKCPGCQAGGGEFLPAPHQQGSGCYYKCNCNHCHRFFPPLVPPFKGAGVRSTTFLKGLSASSNYVSATASPQLLGWDGSIVGRFPGGKRPRPPLRPSIILPCSSCRFLQT